MGVHVRVKAGVNLRRQMQATGIDTIAELTRRMAIASRHGGPSRQYVSRVVNGRERTLTPRTAELIARALGVDADLMFDLVMSAPRNRVTQTASHGGRAA